MNAAPLRLAVVAAVPLFALAAWLATPGCVGSNNPISNLCADGGPDASGFGCGPDEPKEDAEAADAPADSSRDAGQGDSGVGNNCTPACLKPTCASQITACQASPACITAAQCANACTTPNCAQQCNSSQDQAATAYFTCAFTNCNCFVGTTGMVW